MTELRTTTAEMRELEVEGRSGLVPESIWKFIDATIDGLRASGIAGQALKVGNVAPDFSLPDAAGNIVRSDDLFKSGQVVVVFYRGAWCPYCNLHLRGFQRALPRLQALGASLVAISPQLPDSSMDMKERAELKFPVLSDVGNKIARKFGIVFPVPEPLLKLHEKIGRDLEDYNGPAGANELPIPATFLIDRNKTIKLAHVDVNWMKRLDPDDLIAELEKTKTMEPASI